MFLTTVIIIYLFITITGLNVTRFNGDDVNCIIDLFSFTFILVQ